jgi:hypothetical protein
MSDSLRPTLFEALELAPTVQPKYAKEATIQERFESFDQRNPHVFEALKRLSLEMKRRGFTKWSIKAAFEVCRWMAALQTYGDSFKLCNDYHARYARKIMAEVPELANFFELRERRSE